MKSKRFKLLNIAVVCALTLLAVPAETLAGGRCGGRGSSSGFSGRRGAPAEETRAEKARRLEMSYNLGKQIMEGKVQLRSRIPELVSYQGKVLQRHISDDVKQVLGRLSKNQLVAVKDYLDTKFPLSTVSEEELREARFREAKASYEESLRGKMN